MYKFHHDHSKNKYDNNSRLLFTDTDSSMYEMPEMKTKDAYEDFSYEKEMFYFSNYSTNSKYYNSSNKLAARKMKDKAGVAIKESVGIKPKMYSYLVDDNREHKTAKIKKVKIIE